MKKVKRYGISVLAALFVTAVIGAGALFRVDKWVQDKLFQHRGVTSRDIVIIGIDDEALDLLGPYNTWDRNIMASALEALAADPDKLPAVTAIDVLYAGRTGDQADERLAAAARDLGNVITASMAEFGQEITWEDGRAVSVDLSALLSYTTAYDMLRDCTTQGHINVMYDTDGILRHAILYVEPRDGERVYSMACEAARAFLEKKGEELQLPDVRGAGHFYVPYTSRPGDYYDGVSIARLLQGTVPADYWADKIVLIGPYTGALQDTYYTPLEPGSPMFGVEVQANVIQCLIEKNYKTEIPILPQTLFLLLICVAAAVLFRRLKVLPGGAVCAGLIVLGIALPLILYKAGLVTHPLWVPSGVLAVYLVSLAEHYAQAARERQALALEKERIDAELSLATRIQSSAVPKVFPPFPERTEFDIYASMTPAKEVGGDLYDFFLIDEDHVGLVIGDVSGKGVPAALFMMVAQALIHHVAMREKSPAKILQAVNAEICARNPEEMFVTVWMGVLEISTGRLAAANAGHEFPAVKKAGEHFDLIKDRHGFVIGGMEGVRYREYEILMEPGEKLFVYTDGVPEATDAKDEMYGKDRMIEALRSAEDGPPSGVLDAVNKSVKAFIGSAPQFDDLTMLCLQYNGPLGDQTDTK